MQAEQEEKTLTKRKVRCPTATAAPGPSTLYPLHVYPSPAASPLSLSLPSARSLTFFRSFLSSASQR